MSYNFCGIISHHGQYSFNIMTLRIDTKQRYLHITRIQSLVLFSRPVYILIGHLLKLEQITLTLPDKNLAHKASSTCLFFRP